MTDTLVERLFEEMDASPVDDVTCINLAELTQLRDRIIALQAEVARLRNDPNAVHINLLAGRIARPTPAQIVHIYGADALRAVLAALEARND